MYRMSLLTLLAPASLTGRLDVARCTKMALVHDLAESLVGDITPVDNVPKAEKHRREAETMDYVCGPLLGQVGGGIAGADLRALWEEYEEGKTLESVFVHDVDKMELLLQMVEYERANEGRIDLGEFSWVAQKIVLPEVKQWSDEVLKGRDEFWKSVGVATKENSTATTNGVEGITEEKRKGLEEYYGKDEKAE